MSALRLHITPDFGVVQVQVEVYSTSVNRQVTVCRGKNPSLRALHRDGLSRERERRGSSRQVEYNRPGDSPG